MGNRKTQMEKEKEITRYVNRLLSPNPLNSLEEIESIVKPLPKYTGPGEWLRLLK